MRATFKIDSPDSLTATVKMTMTVKEWRELEQQLPTQWPSSRLSSAILSLLRDADKTFYADERDALS